MVPNTVTKPPVTELEYRTCGRAESFPAIHTRDTLDEAQMAALPASRHGHAQ
jgi:hypothetical protein